MEFLRAGALARSWGECPEMGQAEPSTPQFCDHLAESSHSPTFMILIP